VAITPNGLRAYVTNTNSNTVSVIDTTTNTVAGSPIPVGVARHQFGGLRFHDLRHSYGTWLADDGVPVNKVQKVMGHENVTTTLQLYVRKTEDHGAILDVLNDQDPDDDDGAAGMAIPAR
jgi:YVTN family beta-propeller protein